MQTLDRAAAARAEHLVRVYGEGEAVVWALNHVTG